MKKALGLVTSSSEACSSSYSSFTRPCLVHPPQRRVWGSSRLACSSAPASASAYLPSGRALIQLASSSLPHFLDKPFGDVGSQRSKWARQAGARDDSQTADSLFDDPLFRDFGAEFRDMDRRMDNMFKESERLQLELEKQARQGNGRTYRRENSSQESLQGGGMRKSYFSESVTIYGGENSGTYGNPSYAASAASTIPVIFSVICWMTTIVYAAGMAAFYCTYDKTSFKARNRTLFAFLWPFLFVFNEKFRQEFKKALKGQNQGNNDLA